MGSLNFNSDKPCVGNPIWGRPLDDDQIAKKMELQNRAKLILDFNGKNTLKPENEQNEIGLC